MWREHQYWRRRVREQEKFVVALGEMMSEILTSSLPLCQAISWTVLLQASFLLLWACGFASFYSSASGLSSFPAFLLLLDLYWTAQLLRKGLYLLLSGAVTRWFYSALEEVKEGDGEMGTERKGSWSPGLRRGT
jgi:hypothetical protein